MNISFKNPIKIISHDGYWKEKHTLKGIEKAIELGVWGIEEDIFEKDNEFYLGEEWNGNNDTLRDLLKMTDKPIFLDLSAGAINLGKLQYLIAKHNAENYAIIQTANKDYLNNIGKEFKVAWNKAVWDTPLDIFKEKIDYYTLNPAWYITQKDKKEIESNGSEIIAVNITYATPDLDRLYYPLTLLRFEHIMVDYLEDFINFCKEYEIPLWKQKTNN
jgi:glycerophosphoryl diester phosphodiesterase